MGFELAPALFLHDGGNKVIEKDSLSLSSKSVLNQRYNLRSDVGKKAH